ncbi:MAG: hypothetical protein ABI151_13230 [Chitinophagaceae bacterium]
MQFRKTILSLSIFFFPIFICAQSTNLPQGSKHQQLMERLEILLKDDPELNLSGIHPLSRRTAIHAVDLADSLNRQFPYDFVYHLSPVDKYNIQSLRMNSAEWVSGDKSSFLSKKPLWNTFYKTKADLFSVDETDFFLSINPVLQEQQSIETGNGQRVFLNSKGVTGRGLIAKRVGFDFYITDNQERTPLFVQTLEKTFLAVPGVGFYKPFKKTAYDYFDGRGSIYFNAAKYFNFQFGYDRNFIGNGYRSLFLSDFSASNLFLKIDTKIWKLHYTNLFMELYPQFISNPGNILLPKKYAVMHRLGVNVTSNLNVGLFESIIFGRTNRYDFSYLNPIIFLRSVEQQNGSPDNAVVGFDLKWNVAHQGQIYAQLMLDEFVLKELRARKGWWGNKFGIQLGGKYVNAFDVKNLDLQGEVNVVRPFTYAHYNAVGNYTNYNQPLAHPLGSGFLEMIGIMRYQPLPKWNITGKLIFYKRGVDSAGQNLGNNIFLLTDTRARDYGFSIPSGIKATGFNFMGQASYEFRENLFFDGSLMYRNFATPIRTDYTGNSFLLTLGVRVNMFRREYDY